MVYAIIHRVSGFVLDKYEDESDKDCLEQYIANHPDLNVDTLNELYMNYPMLLSNLEIGVLH